MSKHVYFIGIGGIGMSALARVCLEKGYQVSGSTLSGEESLLTLLKNKGAHLYKEHHATHITHDVDVVVITSSIQKNNVELVEAKLRGIEVLHRSQLLDQLLEEYHVIAVSGTHGKTTTTALIGYMLDVAGEDPLIITGGIMPTYQSNVRCGKGKWAVVEADESDGSFLNFSRIDIAVATNVEAEHMEFYLTENNLFSFFEQFLLKATQGRIIGGVSSFYRQFIKKHSSDLNIVYGEEGNVRYCNITPYAQGTQFDTEFEDNTPTWQALQLKLRGEHNVHNSLAAIAVANMLGLSISAVRHAFSTFESVQRRLTYAGSGGGIHVLDDYAHHPTEVKAVLRALRVHHAQDRVFIVFQPHRYTRLRDLMDNFAESFCDADEVLLLPVYSAGEPPLLDVNSEVLFRKIQKCHSKVSMFTEWKQSLESIGEYILQYAVPGDVVVCCGAGDITQLSYALPLVLDKQYLHSKEHASSAILFR